ncbi:hypothetical protein, partial [Leptospira interrogans]|uniref:hypothetical protein n=1 Tax=Leptospira interrogans TaxID=173 RepID=UPI0012933FD3
SIGARRVVLNTTPSVIEFPLQSIVSSAIEFFLGQVLMISISKPIPFFVGEVFENVGTTTDHDFTNKF